MSDRPFDQQNAGYAQELYEQYALNPQSVPESWRRFFSQGHQAAAQAGLILPESLHQNGSGAAAQAYPSATNGVATNGAAAKTAPAAAPAAVSTPERDLRLLRLAATARLMIQAYRDHGHKLARIDPLGSEPPGHPQLDPGYFGDTLEEIENVPAKAVMLLARGDETLGAALSRLRSAYAGSIGYEFEHMEEPTRVRWLWEQVEHGAFTQPLAREEKLRLLERLAQVEGFEQFLHKTYLGQKRFSIEGTEMLVPMLDAAVEAAAANGATDIILGAPHRGRLNVLAHVVNIGYKDILRAFEGVHGKGVLTIKGTGDVKYHLGAVGTYTLHQGGEVKVTLVPNPSHLEFVAPVALGMTRAMQFGEEDGRAHRVEKVLPVLIHGDAAFAGLGIVPETLNLARLKGYSVGGAIHVIVNNQVGFTTDPDEARSTRYSSDVAKGFDFPILHVNADEPEACLAAMRLAMAYRNKYHDDVVIDLVGYRRHGHNEADEPAYTQPRMYDKISKHPTVRRIWSDRMIQEGVTTDAGSTEIDQKVSADLRRVQEGIKAGPEEPHEPKTSGAPEEAALDDMETAVSLDDLRMINEAALTAPEGFKIHPKLKKQLDRRRENFGEESKIEWAHAETLAFGSLLKEGFLIRLSGEDVQRGTFSQRHLVLHDPETGATTMPLSQIAENKLEIYNSPLSEAGVLGFDYGYSVAAKRDLVLWEAQFGDFVNSAQVAVDQFIASGREKWEQLSNLALLLPHGYEGQGPEHSSARLERFLTLCAEGNMRVLYPSTPAQYFHMLRQQAHVRPERPMVVMTPKSLLRLPAAASPVRELVHGKFQHVLDDPTADNRKDKVRRLVLCTGKIYYELHEHEARAKAEDVAIVRIEQLYPFPATTLEKLIASYPNLEEVVWTQEEPRNMGALTFVGPRLRLVIPRKVPMRYAARPDRASPAEGKPADHNREQQRILREALVGAEDAAKK